MGNHVRRYPSKPHTPSARIRVIYGRIDIAKVNLPHKSIDLLEGGRSQEVRRENGSEELISEVGEKSRLTLSCREKLANLDCL